VAAAAGQEILDRALAIARASEARKGVDYLTAAGYVADSPSAIAQLLRVNQREFGEDIIGDYLGEGGRTPAEQAFMVSLRDAYTRAMPRNAGDSFDEALRQFLTNGGFRLPGESQKVERLLETFARRYARDNPDVCTEVRGRGRQPGDASERPPDTPPQDAALVLAFSVVMLNTDLHRQAIKKSQKMRREQFVKNLSGVNRGGDFDKDLLEVSAVRALGSAGADARAQELYESVARNEIRFRKDDGPEEAESDEESVDDVEDDEEAFAEAASVQVQRGLVRRVRLPLALTRARTRRGPRAGHSVYVAERVPRVPLQAQSRYAPPAGEGGASHPHVQTALA
jgi:hypothetical protein